MCITSTNIGLLSFILEKSETQSVMYEVWNSLHSAAKTGDITVIEAILSRGQDINLKGNDGNTPLALAAACGRS